MHVRSCSLRAGIAAIVLSFPALAAADASIAVRLIDAEGRPVDGTVTLQKSGVTRSCRTTAARCTVTAPAGSYTVTMRPVRGSAPPPRSFTVPASGSISLALTAGPATTATSTTAVSTAQPAVRAGTTTATRTTSGTPVTRATSGSASPVARATRTTARRATRVRPGSVTTRPVGVATPGVRGIPTPSTGTSPGDGTTSGGSSTTTARPATTTATTTAVAQHTDTAAARNLSTGRALSVQGTVLDAAGRPTDAALTVRRAGSVVGTARTTAGRFSLYDLPAATYEVTLSSSRGTNGTGRFTVGSATSRVTLRVP